MKFQSIDELERIDWLRQKRERKIRLRKVSRKDRAKLKQKRILQSHQNISSNLEPADNRVSIELPETISLTTNYEQTINAINTIRNTVLKDRLPVLLHFDNVESVSPAAALIMTAEIYRCRNLRAGRDGMPIVNGNWPENITARKILSDMGFYKIMGLPDNLDTPTPKEMDDTIHLGFASLNQVNPELIANFHQSLLEKIDVIISDIESKRLQGAIIEAIGNATEHAYKIKTEYQFMSKRSWMSGYIDIKKRELMFMVLDQGAGVPNTLDPTLVERAISMGSFRGTRPTDAELIQKASILRRTSTGSSGRGKGFGTMKHLIKTVGDGELRVFSNSGLYTFSSNGNEDKKDHNGSMGGTLVQWRLHKN